ncbi:MAG: HAD hydrolase family protein [Sedimentisphaerales bacterium]|nr:HAD hydrolase family protein [Sedimentisphaerales bacterium]
MSKNSQPRLENIQMLILDVDGVLTDGTIIVNADGTESKSFSALDGHGIRLWKRSGLKVAFLSGRKSEPTVHRARQLEVDYVLEDCHDKLKTLKNLLEKLSLAPEEIAYIGDDWPDLPVIKYVGFGVATANAAEEVKQHADYITTSKGGNGAIRETVEYILKNNNKWQQLVERYTL